LREILLVPIGAVDGALLDYLALIARETLDRETRLASRPLSPDSAYDAVRRQHHSTRLLRDLETHFGRDAETILGVTELDLFVPILTFVFGEARLGGPAAVLSTARLAQGYYGLPEDSALLYRRAEKEAFHELGHTFGLIHCPDYECVMHFSNSVEEVDLKGDQYCRKCWKQILPGHLRGRRGGLGS